MAADCFSKQIRRHATVANGAEKHAKSGTGKVLGKTWDD